MPSVKPADKGTDGPHVCRAVPHTNTWDGSCNFCTREVQELWDVHSDDEHRHSHMRVCVVCMKELLEQVTPWIWAERN